MTQVFLDFYTYIIYNIGIKVTGGNDELYRTT